MQTLGSTSPRRAAITGLAFALPLLALNAVVAARIEPLITVIRPGDHTGPIEYSLLLLALLLLPVGASVALSPIWHKGGDGPRSDTLANLLVAALLVSGFLVLAIAFGSEIYRCDVLRIPNCD